MRRGKPQVRPIQPDVRHNSTVLATFIQHMMIGGKKSLALRLMYDTLDLIQEKSGKPGIETFDAAMKSVGPSMEVRPRRVGGATYQVPREVSADRKLALSIRWFLGAARGKKGKPIHKRLAEEILLSLKNEGSAIKKKLDTHRMAEANRAFAHFAW